MVFVVTGDPNVYNSWEQLSPGPNYLINCYAPLKIWRQLVAAHHTAWPYKGFTISAIPFLLSLSCKNCRYKTAAACSGINTYCRTQSASRRAVHLTWQLTGECSEPVSTFTPVPVDDGCCPISYVTPFNIYTWWTSGRWNCPLMKCIATLPTSYAFVTKPSATKDIFFLAEYCEMKWIQGRR